MEQNNYFFDCSSYCNLNSLYFYYYYSILKFSIKKQTKKADKLESFFKTFLILLTVILSKNIYKYLMMMIK